MPTQPKQRQILTVVLVSLLAAALLLLILYVRQRLFTQTEPIVLAT